MMRSLWGAALAVLVVGEVALAADKPTDFDNWLHARPLATTPGADDEMPLRQGGETRRLFPLSSFMRPDGANATLPDARNYFGLTSNWARQVHEVTGGGVVDVIGVGCAHQLLWADQNITGCLDSATFYSFDRSMQTFVSLANVGAEHPNVGDAIGVNWVTWNSAETVSATHNVRYTIQTADCAAAPTGAVCGGADATTLTNIALKLGKCLDGTGSNCTGHTTLAAALLAYSPDPKDVLFSPSGYQAYQTPAENQAGTYSGNPATILDQPWTGVGAAACNGGTTGCNITAVGTANTAVSVNVGGADGGPSWVLQRVISGRGSYSGDLGAFLTLQGGIGSANTGGQLFALTTTYTGTHGAAGTADSVRTSFNTLFEGAAASRMHLGAGLFMNGQNDPGIGNFASDNIVATTMNINGATIGTNKLAVAGTGLISGLIIDASAGNVPGGIGYSGGSYQSNGELWNFNNSANNVAFGSIGAGWTSGSPTGGAKGNGTINAAAGFYDNNIRLTAAVATAATQSTPASPLGTADATGVMMGLAGTITPLVTGRVKITITGSINNSTQGQTAVAYLRTGTGAAPANADALTGNVRGNTDGVPYTAGQTYEVVAHPMGAIVTGLTLGVPIWIDAQLKTSGGTATLYNPTVIAVEF